MSGPHRGSRRGCPGPPAAGLRPGRPRPPRGAWLVCALLGLLLAALLSPAPVPAGGAAAPDGPRPRVLVHTLDDAITPVTAGDAVRGLDTARDEGFDAYVIRLDTPGGLDTSMREIVQAILRSPVPVIVHVSPSGARAASAGAIITFAAHVAAMAPGTTIGAATPVTGEGEDVSRKVVNDAAAYAASLAQLRGRDVEFARQAVLSGAALPADEALRRGVVEIVAPGLGEVLAAADGTTVTVGPDDRSVRLATAGAAVREYDPGVLRGVLGWLANPSLTYLLLTVGLLALLFELASPGVGAGAVVSALCLLLALFSLSLLPVDVTGLALLAVAAALFVAEVLAPGVGVFALGGAVALALSAVFLLPRAPGVSASLALVVPAAVVVAVFAVAAGRFAARARRAPVRHLGMDRLVGEQVVAARVDDAEGRTGQGFLDGAWWRLRAAGGRLVAGRSYVVTGTEGLTLLVGEPAGQRAGGEPAAEDRAAGDQAAGDQGAGDQAAGEESAGEPGAAGGTAGERGGSGNAQPSGEATGDGRQAGPETRRRP